MIASCSYLPIEEMVSKYYGYKTNWVLYYNPIIKKIAFSLVDHEYKLLISNSYATDVSGTHPINKTLQEQLVKLMEHMFGGQWSCGPSADTVISTGFKYLHNKADVEPTMHELAAARDFLIENGFTTEG